MACIFHLEEYARAPLKARRVTLKNGGSLEADLCDRRRRRAPAHGSRETAGLAIDRGVVVNDFLETSDPGDLCGRRYRALARSAIAARPSASSIGWSPSGRDRPRRQYAGPGEEFDAVPFFWSQHYDVQINYVGHAERWDALAVEGDMRPRIACCGSNMTAACWPSPRYSATWRASRPKWRWNRPSGWYSLPQVQSAGWPGAVLFLTHY